eukprot:5452693-Pleurochrysis_carterae.AAC.1
MAFCAARVIFFAGVASFSVSAPTEVRGGTTRGTTPPACAPPQGRTATRHMLKPHARKWRRVHTRFNVSVEFGESARGRQPGCTRVRIEGCFLSAQRRMSAGGVGQMH